MTVLDKARIVCTEALGKAIPLDQRAAFTKVSSAELKNFVESSGLTFGETQWFHTFSWRDLMIFVCAGSYKEYPWVILLDLGELFDTGEKAPNGDAIWMPRGVSEIPKLPPKERLH